MFKHPTYVFWIIYLCILFQNLSPAFAADNAQVIFLHHSTGGNVIDQGNVLQRLADYNDTHGTNYLMTVRPYPDTPYDWNNYPYDYWNLWINGACDSGQPGIECMDTLTAEYDVIIYKHCFPSAAVLEDTGRPRIGSARKSLENYKLQYRALRGMMDNYPVTTFIVWTLAPLHRNETTPGNAARAKAFVDWVRNDYLTEDGTHHPNIFIFDFWGIVAEEHAFPRHGAVNCLKYEYEQSHINSDSHPNTTANAVVGELFAQFIIGTVQDIPVLSDSNSKQTENFPNESIDDRSDTPETERYDRLETNHSDNNSDIVIHKDDSENNNSHADTLEDSTGENKDNLPAEDSLDDSRAGESKNNPDKKDNDDSQREADTSAFGSGLSNSSESCFLGTLSR